MSQLKWVKDTYRDLLDACNIIEKEALRDFGGTSMREEHNGNASGNTCNTVVGHNPRSNGGAISVSWGHNAAATKAIINLAMGMNSGTSGGIINISVGMNSKSGTTIWENGF